MALLKKQAIVQELFAGYQIAIRHYGKSIWSTTSLPLFRFFLFSHIIELNGWIFFFWCVYKMIESLADLGCFNRHFPFTLISIHMMFHFLFPLLIHTK